MTDPWARPNQPPPPPPPPGPPPGFGDPQVGPPGPPPQQEPPSSGSRLKNLFRDPLSIVLVVVIVMALALAGLLGGELYARSRADDVVAKTV